MYGNCEVLSMEENAKGITKSSTTANPNNSNNNYNIATPSFNFMDSFPNSYQPFPPLFPTVKKERGKEEMNMESMSGGSELNIEGGDDDDKDGLDTFSGGVGGGWNLLQPFQVPQPPSKKKRYRRHTANQIQLMEALFRECPHPDDKQRMKLSQELGLKPRQVKFWFQNRRTQSKAQHDRTENAIMRSENDNLKHENYRLEAMLKSLFCPSCGNGSILGEVEYDEQQLHLENARLKEELDRVCAIASSGYNGRSFGAPPPPFHPPLELDMSGGYQDPPCNKMMFPSQERVLIQEHERSLAMELGMSSMHELVKLCHAKEPIWVRDNNNSMELLNVAEYSRMFSWHVDHFKQQYNHDELRIEGSRDTSVVIMNSINLVEAFLDAGKWMELFPCIVGEAKTIQIVASGVSGHANGSLHLMYAEFQVISPLVQTRKTHFLRYCHHNVEEGRWVIVDFPIDNFHAISHSISRYRRCPSGCIIQDLPNGYSRVTWVEHGEIVEEKPTHQIFNDYVHSNMAFGAKRWLAVLQRQSERVASFMARNISHDLGVIQSLEGRKRLMKLAEKMTRALIVNMSNSRGQSWTALSESSEDTVRVTTRRIADTNNALILTAVSTISLPFSHHQVFHLLRNQTQRSQIEALSNGSLLHEVAHIANGSHPGNCISLFRVNVASNSSQNVELMLQESCTDGGAGSLVVYATMEVDYIHLVMSGEDPSTVPLLPLGFSILPRSDGRQGCLLTAAVQAHATANPNGKLNLSTVSAINTHISAVLHQINAALLSNSSNNNNDDNDT